MFDLFNTSPKSMIMLGDACFDLTKVQRFHRYNKKKDFCIYVRFDDGDSITINYNSVDARDAAFTSLRKAYCLYTDEERAARDAELKAELEKKKEAEKNEPRHTIFGTIYPTNVETATVDSVLTSKGE